MEDPDIISLFFDRNETAIAMTKQKYESYLRTIAYNILHNNEDCEESLNDTYLAAWNTIPPQKPEVLSAYLAKLARRISIDIFRRNNRVKRRASQFAVSLSELDDCIAVSDKTVEEFDTELLAQAINDFLKNLSPEKRDIFICRYFYSDSIRKIAFTFNISEAKTKSILYRIRIELKGCLEKEGFM